MSLNYEGVMVVAIFILHKSPLTEEVYVNLKEKLKFESENKWSNFFAK